MSSSRRSGVWKENWIINLRGLADGTDIWKISIAKDCPESFGTESRGKMTLPRFKWAGRSRHACPCAGLSFLENNGGEVFGGLPRGARFFPKSGLTQSL